jgi:hypothetical protein
MNIPTTEEIKEQCISIFEASLGQTVPIAQKAFIRVMSCHSVDSFHVSV